MDKKSLNEKQLKGDKDQNCKVVTSAAFSEVSMNGKTKETSALNCTHLVLFTQNVTEFN